MFASKNFDAAVLDLGFLGMPLSQRLFPAMVINVSYAARRREGYWDTIQRTCGSVLRSIWKCFG